MFLTPNPNWKTSNCWFKNSPVGVNEIGKWIKSAAEVVGLDVERKKICNHSIRSSAVSRLAKAGVGEQQLMKVTGHSNSNSIKSYLQLDVDHHETIIEKMRQSTTTSSTSISMDNAVRSIAEPTGTFLQQCSNVSFTNCTFSFHK